MPCYHLIIFIDVNSIYKDYILFTKHTIALCMFAKCIACVHYGGNENSSHAGGRELICTVMHFTLIRASSE